MEPSIDADATYDPVNFSFPHGTHLCAMEVDTETGATTMRKYVCVDDIGTIVNPLIVEGQVHGGLVQGIAQALWEGAVYDEQGTLVTGSFVDYTLPTAADTISFVTDHTDLAVDDEHARHQGRRRGGHASPRPRPSSTRSSTRVRHLGVNDVLMPCTPERVWKAIQTRRAHSGAATGEAQPHFADDTLNQDPSAARRTERHSDPRSVRLPGTRPPSTRPSRRSPRAATTSR